MMTILSLIRGSTQLASGWHGCYYPYMRQALYLSLLRVSLIAASMLSWHAAQADDTFGAEVHIASCAVLPSSPVPMDEPQVVVGRGTDGGSSAICENEGPSPGDVRAKAVDRALQLARASLRHRSTSQLPPVLWARTFSVSLLKRNVRLDI